MKRSALRLLALAGLLTTPLLAGCTVSTFFGRVAGPLFESPRPVKKLTNAVDKNARLSVLWVGHATALIQIDDKLILTDPVFTSTVGVLSKRLVEPGFDAENLPALDAVLISHLHFDHLSLGSLSMLEPKVRMLLMPRTGVTYLTDFSFPVLELRTWQAYEKDGLRITATPVQHLGFRYGLDGDWMNEGFTGYVIEYHGLKVYFGGDTAYDQKLFVDTGQRFPDLDVALLPIGPIEPRDFMRRVHVDPGEAIQAFFDLGAKRMVPVHYDTFVNSTDAPGDALKALDAAKKKWDLGTREIVPIAIGERRVFVKVGEGPSAAPAAPAAKPAPAPAKVTPATKPAPPKNDVPDDDKLD
jgi:L-ascorbate metabolism protein UlaG (beta-lactamase superfamily)